MHPYYAPESPAAQAVPIWLPKPTRRRLNIQSGGYLANENAELLQTLVHAGAKPHKTIDGEPDPRPRDKRHADTLVTLLELAAGSNGVPGRPRVMITIDYDTCATPPRMPPAT
jgi:hypothetical protein